MPSRDPGPSQGSDAVQQRSNPRIVLDGTENKQVELAKKKTSAKQGKGPKRSDGPDDTPRGRHRGHRKTIIRQPLVSKVILLLCNFVFMVMGLAMIVVSAYAMQSDYSRFFTNEGFAVGIAAGIILLITSCLGFCGAIKGEAKFLVPYATILMLNLVLQIAGAALLLETDKVLSQAESAGFKYQDLDSHTAKVLDAARAQINKAFQAGGCNTTKPDANASEYVVACNDDSSWISSFVNDHCATAVADVESTKCFQSRGIDVQQPHDSVGTSAYCMCQATMVQYYTKYSRELAIVALAIAVFQLLLICNACNTLCKRRKLYLFEPPKEVIGEPYTKDGKAYIGVFPLLYGNCVGFRQLAFFAVLFLPILVSLPRFFDALLPDPVSASWIIDVSDDPRAPLTIDADHCDITLEADFDGTLAATGELNQGQIKLELIFSHPRSFTSDPDSWVSFCGAREQSTTGIACGFSNQDYEKQFGSGQLGAARGCTNYTAAASGLQQGPSHLCVMNTADKAFISTAYAGWGCKIRVIAGQDTTMPPLVIKSTETQMHGALGRVTVSDIEPDTRQRTWSNARYHFCDRRLPLSDLTLEVPDARLELDCFDTSGKMLLRDTDQSHFHVFSDAPGSNFTVDVELQRGDLYFWDTNAVLLNYDDSSVPASKSSLCTVAPTVDFEISQQTLQCSSNTKLLLPPGSDPQALQTELCGSSDKVKTVLNVQNNITTAGIVNPLPNATNTNTDRYHNHVQVEVGVFVDSVYDQGKTFVRQEQTKTFVPLEPPAKVYRNRQEMTSVKASFSDFDMQRLKELFHYDEAEMPIEDVVDIDILAEGIPLGTFTWYKNMVYSFIPPETLSFISLDLLNPLRTRVSLELVDNFCPLPYMQNLEAEKEVLNRVYEVLFSALEPLPKYNIFTFVQLKRTYQGGVFNPGGAFDIATEYVFKRDDSTEKMYRLITKNQAIRENVTFVLLIGINIALTLLSALLFSYFCIKLLRLKRFTLLREMVGSYRADIGAILYLQMEKEFKKKELQLKSESARIDYTIVVKTGDKIGAGTSGRVFITIVGNYDESREIELRDAESMGNRSLFDKGMVSRFNVSAADVGPVARVRIRHEMNLGGLNTTPSWYLKAISVQTPRTLKSSKPPYLDVRESFEFPCNRWFAKSRGANGVDEGLEQVLEAKGSSSSGGGMFSGVKNPLSGSFLSSDPGEEESDDEFEEQEDLILDEENRQALVNTMTEQLEPKACPFWLVDAMICVQRRQVVVKRSGKDIPPAEVEETVKMFNVKMMNKYLSVWKDKVEEARIELRRTFKGMRGNLMLDELGNRVIDPATGQPVGETLIRQGINKGYRAKVVLVSDLPEATKKKMEQAKDREMESNFHLFDTTGTGDLDASELRVAMLARGFKFSLAECKDIISDLDEDRTGAMGLSEYKKLQLMRSRELPENFEAALCFDLFKDKDREAITFKTLKRAVAEMGEDIDARGIQELIDRCDFDGSGDVCLEDFLHVMGQPNNEATIKKKIQKITIPNLGTAAQATAGLLGPSPDTKTFQKLVFRYWRRYRMMTEEADKQRFLKCCAFASRPGNYLDKLPRSPMFLRRCGLSEDEAKGVLKRIRNGMLLESFYAYFDLSEPDKKRYLHLLLRHREEYFQMGVTKRAWFVRQSLPDREHYLKKQMWRNRVVKLKAFFSQLFFAELYATIVHIALIFFPAVPVVFAAYLYDSNYKKYHPNADQAAFQPIFTSAIAICSVYVAFAAVYIIWYYLVKNLRSRHGKEGPLDSIFRRLYYFSLFATSFLFVIVVVCCLYWIVLGTVLKPSSLIPVFIAVLVVAGFAFSLQKALSTFRRICTNCLEDHTAKLMKKKKEAIRFKLEVTRAKAARMADCERTGKPFNEAGKFQNIEEGVRAGVVNCNRIGSAGTAFLVSKGLTQADIMIATIGAVLVLLLLIAFIFAGVKAFTEPGSPVAATVNSGLTTVAGGGSNANAKAGISPDIVDKAKDEITAIGERISEQADGHLTDAQKKFAELDAAKTVEV